jgi:hypothetical protein
MKKTPRWQLPEDDDGRTIAPMNVEGMPWHTPKRSETPRDPNAQPLLGKDLLRYLFSAVGAGLLIVFAFGIAGAALILFCTEIWFK